ncbi:MAG: hypothetical protein HQL69_03845 [Magnetococcales bacterium]|nr:hypothetical protein [Magnetococcales bacterium]
MTILQKLIMGGAAGNSGYALFATGSNSSGNLGLGDTLARNSPTQVGTGESWSYISASSVGGAASAMGIHAGKLYAWGNNFSGELGLNNTTGYSSPVQVGTEENWALVDILTGSTLAIKKDGTLWSWGINNSGQLGTGDTANRSSPVQVGSLTDWANVKISSAGHTLALKTDGTLWAWGYNNHGQLGNSSTAHTSSPIQIGTETNWTDIGVTKSGSLAINSAGNVFAWGLNHLGQLGQNDITNRSSPVQVGAGTTWAAITPGYNSIWLKNTNNELFATGRCAEACFGNGVTSAYDVSNLTQLGTDNDWSKLFMGMSYTGHAIKTDGTFWAWGLNSSGECGLGTNTLVSVPVQLGNETNWVSSDHSGNFGFFLKAV